MTEPLTTSFPDVDVVDVPDDRARLDVARLDVDLLDVDRLPRLGCRLCGLTAQQHGPAFLHRFVRPQLPCGCDLDEAEPEAEADAGSTPAAQRGVGAEAAEAA